jgi:ParB family chromosome partitioning protein
MSTDKYHTYRGDVRALAAVDGTLVFVTVHPEGRATAVYRLDGEKLTLSSDPLPAGGQVLLATSEGLWVGGTDRRLYRLPAAGGKPAAVGPELGAAPMALAPLAGDRLAVVAATQVVVLGRGDGAVLQTLDLPEEATCLAADPTGQWLAAGTAKGTVAVFECETVPEEFRPSDAAPLHEAAVTALLFEADELRFLSAGADQKLLSTHARGRLEAEDRGRGANHTEPITAMIAGPADRFLTGSTDGTLKSWPRAKGARPVTLKDGVGKVVALAIAAVHGKPQVAAACQDNTLRLFRLDDEGKFGDAVARVHGVEAWAEHERRQLQEPRRREALLRTLAEFDDAASIKQITAVIDSDPDPALRLLACRLLGESKHPQAAKALEGKLRNKQEAVRLAAFEGLRRHAGPEDLRPLVLALEAEKADVGRRAVEALEELAARDDRALARLVTALESKTPEVRRAALESLEKVHGPSSPEPSLSALKAPHADLRRLALLRLFQRQLLHDPRAQAALRWRGEDPDPEVRRVAFLLSLYTREKLLQALRQRDPELQRQLAELESGTLPALEEAPAAEETPPEDQTSAAVPTPYPGAMPPGGQNILQTLLTQLGRLAVEGKVSAEEVARLRQQMEEGGGGLTGIIARIMTQIQAAQRGRAAHEEEDE